MSTDFYLPNLREEISQGDIISNIPISRVRFPDAVPVIREILGILLTSDCEFDKPNSKYALIAEIRPLSEVSPNSHGNIKNFKTLNAFYIPSIGSISESYVDFRRTYQVDKEFVLDRAAKSLRVKSITEEGRLALQRQIAIFYGYDRKMDQQTASSAGTTVEKHPA